MELVSYLVGYTGLVGRDRAVSHWHEVIGTHLVDCVLIYHLAWFMELHLVGDTG
jgi:hypothetical protein